MRFLVLLIVLLLPVQAAALSCIRPSVERTFQEASADERAYVVVHGRLTFDMSALPKNQNQVTTDPVSAVIPGRLVGKSLSKRGFETPFDRGIKIEVSCLGPWCGSAQSGQDVLAFVRREGAGYLLEINPCGSLMFASPKTSQLRRVTACFRGERCEIP